MGYVIKFGGSLLFSENSNDVNENKVKELVKVIQSSDKVHGIVCGGGKIARKYIHAGRNLGFNEQVLDTLGILVSRVNAQLLICAIGNNAYSNPITNIEEAKYAQSLNKLFVAGGFVPKQSTTTVAMQLCEALKYDLIVLTDVDGIYDKDPDTHKDAKKFDQISYHELKNLLHSRSGQEQTAGKYQIFDLLSFEILQRSHIRIRFINGSELKNLRLLLSEDFQSSKIGTIIVP